MKLCLADHFLFGFLESFLMMLILQAAVPVLIRKETEYEEAV